MIQFAVDVLIVGANVPLALLWMLTGNTYWLALSLLEIGIFGWRAWERYDDIKAGKVKI